MVSGKCMPVNTFLCITSTNLSMSVCFGKNFCITLVVSSTPTNCDHSLIYDLSGLIVFSK